jgi:hypothetical protein
MSRKKPFTVRYATSNNPSTKLEAFVMKRIGEGENRVRKSSFSSVSVLVCFIVMKLNAWVTRSEVRDKESFWYDAFGVLSPLSFRFFSLGVYKVSLGVEKALINVFPSKESQFFTIENEILATLYGCGRASALNFSELDNFAPHLSHPKPNFPFEARKSQNRE